MQCEALIKFTWDSFEIFQTWFETNGSEKQVENLFTISDIDIIETTENTYTINITVETVNDEYIPDDRIANALFLELGIYQTADMQFNQQDYSAEIISFDLQDRRDQFIISHRQHKFRGSFEGMDCEVEDTSDLPYIEGDLLNNRKIAYPFNFSPTFRENMFSYNQELYAPEIEHMINEINTTRNESGLESLDIEDYVMCENSRPECGNRICIINKKDADLDHDPSLSERFNEEDFCKDLDSRRESFFDVNRIFIMHKSCNRSKGGRSYNEEKIRQIYEEEVKIKRSHVRSPNFQGLFFAGDK